MDNENGNSVAEEQKEEQVETSKTTEQSNEELAKAKKAFEDQKRRAEIAEEENKKLKAKLPDTTGNSSLGERLSDDDIVFLASKTTLIADERQEMRDWAKFKGISLEKSYEHLKDKFDKSEAERRTAAATQTRGGQRSGSGTTGDQLLRDAERGILPDDDAGIMALAEAELARKMKR